jgi:hypothetical protein
VRWFEVNPTITKDTATAIAKAIAGIFITAKSFDVSFI